MASFVPGLRRAGSKLSRDFFICHQCQARALAPCVSRSAGESTVLRSIRFQSNTAPFSQGGSLSVGVAPPLASLSQSIGSAERTASKKFFPEASSRSVAYWLLGSAASVFGIVVFGGLTRLTESGYVMIDSSQSLADRL
jgi:cytochrome c oxidase assembly protein subunit 15